MYEKPKRNEISYIKSNKGSPFPAYAHRKRPMAFPYPCVMHRVCKIAIRFVLGTAGSVFRWRSGFAYKNNWHQNAPSELEFGKVMLFYGDHITYYKTNYDDLIFFQHRAFQIYKKLFDNWGFFFNIIKYNYSSYL